MKLNRKLCAVLLALSMLLSLFPAASAADAKVSYGEAQYQSIALSAYAQMPDFHGGAVAAQDKAGNWGLIDTAGRPVVPFRYSDVTFLAGDLFRITDGKYNMGIVNAAGKMVRTPANVSISAKNGVICIYGVGAPAYYTPGMAPAKEIDYRLGSYPAALERFESFDRFFGDYYAIWDHGKFGLADSSGKVLFAPGEYDDYSPYTFGGSTAIVVTSYGSGSAKYALVSDSKQVLIPMGTYGGIYPFGAQGLFYVEQYDANGGRSGVVDFTGKVIVPLDDYKQFGVLSPQGCFTAVSYDYDSDSNPVHITSKLFDQSGKVVKTYTGKMVNTLMFSDMLSFSTDGMKLGLMDLSGKELLPAQFDSFYEGMNGDMISYRFDPDTYQATMGLYSSVGKELLPPVYLSIYTMENGKYLVYGESTSGVYDSAAGKFSIPMRQESLIEVSEALLQVWTGEGEALLDMAGNPVLPAGSSLATFNGGDLSYSVTLEKLWAEEYEGYTGSILPVCRVNGADTTTYYVDYLTGKVALTLPCAASNINADGLFVYQAANGLYGLGSTKADLSSIAYASGITIRVDGKDVKLDAYALKDGKGYPTNYLKLRDVAAVLNGTKAQFNVSWDGSVNIAPGKPYTDQNGSELSTPFSGDRAYSVSTAATYIGGKATDLAAITLTDDAGKGYTYYKLRDLGEALGFSVTWDGAGGVIKVETDKPYTG